MTKHKQQTVPMSRQTFEVPKKLWKRVRDSAKAQRVLVSKRACDLLEAGLSAEDCRSAEVPK